jgi:hypothetical protein
LTLLAEEWLQTPINPVMDIAPLPNGDNQINLLDFAELSQDWKN